MSRKCETCKHWDRDGGRYDYYDSDAKGLAITAHSLCGKINLRDKYDPWPTPGGPSTVAAFTQDASGYQADLWTMPDFGCELWEPLEPQS